MFTNTGRSMACGRSIFIGMGSQADVCHSLFFFQAEDGIRDYKVTGVQTCALPICGRVVGERLRLKHRLTAHESGFLKEHAAAAYKMTLPAASYSVARGFKPGVTTQV